MFTPKRSAPPEATRPGRMVSCGQSRLPARPTTPGPKARKTMPRRIGTTRHTEARSVRTRPMKLVLAIGRGEWVSLSRRSSSRGCRRAAMWAATAPRATSTGTTTTQPGDGEEEPVPVARLRRQRAQHHLGARQRVQGRADLAEDVERTGGHAERGADQAHEQDAAGPRRTASPAQATTCEAQVAATIQSTTTSWAPHRPSGPLPKDIAPSSVQLCTSQATLSGVRSSAPRWSVVGLTGKATPCSRDRSSRPPPDAIPDSTLISEERADAPTGGR